MKINIEIDDEANKKLLKYSKSKPKKEVINKSLDAFIKYQMRLKMVSLKGKVKWVGDLDNDKDLRN